MSCYSLVGKSESNAISSRQRPVGVGKGASPEREGDGAWHGRQVMLPYSMSGAFRNAHSPKERWMEL